MARTPRWRRRSGGSPAGALLPTARWRGGPTWRRVVGRTLAEVTVPVGVDESGTLRVMAQNEAARREILARGEHVVAAWNTVRGEQASRLACWVREGLRPAAVGRTRRRRADPVVADPDMVARAEARAQTVRAPEVRRALAEAMARWAAAGRPTRDEEKSG